MGGSSAGSAGTDAAGGTDTGGQAPSCETPITGGVDLAALLTAPQRIAGEDATLTGAAVIAADGSGFEGRGFVDLKGDEGGMVWLLDVPATGEYGLTFRYAADEARDMLLNVNCVDAVAPTAFNDTGGWNDAWQSDVTTLVTLRRGTNRVALVSNGGSGPNFDSLQLSPPTCVVSGGAATCEAEKALLTLAASPSGLGSGWSGTGFADMFGSEGGIHWVLDVPTAGKYTLTFFYTQDDDRDMTLTVNGAEIAASLAFHDTDNWNIDWIGDVSIDVELRAGLNSVQLATNGNSGPNFDKLQVTASNGGGAHD